MERLTTNKPVSKMNMLELAHNCCYADENRCARFRSFSEDIDARELARKLMHMYGEWDIDDDAMLSDEIFDFEMADNLQYDVEDMTGLLAQFYLHLWAMADLRERLKHYEDIEEQGLLLKLPVPLGETVYILEDDWQPDESCPENEWIFKCIKYAMPVSFESHMIDEWGKTVFLTKEEAEAALEEMKQGQKE